MSTPFAERVRRVSRVNGNEALIMNNGSQYIIVTPNDKKAGRSLSLDLGIIDEAFAQTSLGLVGALGGLRAWGGPSDRYEAPEGGAGDVAGPRGERVASDWDELSAGRDPTDVGHEGPT